MLGLELKPVMVEAIDKIDSAVVEIVQGKAGAAIVQPSLPRRRIVELLLQTGWCQCRRCASLPTRAG